MKRTKAIVAQKVTKVYAPMTITGTGASVGTAVGVAVVSTSDP